MDPYGIITIVGAFFIGAIVGSFINATAMRTVAEKKWWGDSRSVCDHCGETLSGKDLVPLFSFILLRGNCRYCGKAITRRHFIAEVVCATLTAALAWHWGLSMALLMSVSVLWISLFNSLTDIENGYIYDVWAVSLGVLGLVIRLSQGWGAVLDGLLGGALGFGLIALIILVSRGGMGWGDAMLMLGIGGAVGWKYCALSLYCGFLVGGVVVLPLLVMKKLKRKDAIPLGPFLAAGSVLILFFGNPLIARLARLFNYAIVPSWPWL